ncbi:hypothetical protein [Amycolatopsis sp. NPDC057786]|uniref:aa3-type cytochrome oxidase subunit CtaJ n=1 Tax=Amycolatopsis sp. NPDC057786 TaxID=3346250 RepID=UPI0036725812
MNLVETILVFAVIPLVIYALCGVATLRSKGAGVARYRPGQPWEYPAMWWSANPDGVGARHSHAGGATAVGAADGTSVTGGARGNW